MTPESSAPDVMDKLVSLCKRRGFIFQSSEIYGGTGSVWDYGPLGVELKRNLQDRWWRDMVRARDDIEGLDSAILMHPRVWEASGHVSGFADPLVECRACKRRFRADEDNIKGTPGTPDVQCPVCGAKGTIGESRQFNLMFKTFMGPVEDTASIVYLRPETAQGTYVNFLNVQQATRQKVPFGIAQIGKAFRNEITPGNFIFRTREFEQMEMQFFVEPGTDMEWFAKWRAWRMDWHLSLGLSADRLRYYDQQPDELAHYARAASDIQFDFGGSLGFSEIEGVHNRGDFDLTQHQQFSGKKLEYFDQPNNRRFVPYIVETACGPNRTLLALLVNAYREESVEGEDEGRTMLALSADLAPVKAGVFPLVKKDGMPEMAHRLADDLRPKFAVFYDESGAIGRRYRRQDEVGTPCCITIDGQSITDGTVTIRDRDTLLQERVAAERVADVIAGRIAAAAA
ncbi:MAG TPA: glycine--tRNA ligase [Gemmatimonadaceae bacterium]|nr:glycine--tRNA ligase [Gemmatimonadaceae bacterium]